MRTVRPAPRRHPSHLVALATVVAALAAAPKAEATYYRFIGGWRF